MAASYSYYISNKSVREVTISVGVKPTHTPKGELIPGSHIHNLPSGGESKITLPVPNAFITVFRFSSSNSAQEFYRLNRALSTAERYQITDAVLKSILFIKPVQTVSYAPSAPRQR